MSEPGDLIRTKREKLGISQAQLGARIGKPGQPISQTTIQKIEDGRTKRSKYFPEIARELDIPLRDLDSAFGDASAAMLPAEALVGRKDLPIYGSAEGGEGTLIVTYDPIEYVKRPFMLETVRGGYGILVTGESMVPIVRPGDIVLVNPHLPPRINDVVVVFRQFLGDITATVKEYRGQTDTLWRLRRYRPKQTDFTLPRAQWQDCHAWVGKYKGR